MNIISNLLVKFISVDAISTLIAKLIAKLLKVASQKGGDKWDTSKVVLKKAAIWINLFNEVYEDDTMTLDEEEKVAQAIASETPLEKVVEILKK